MRFLILLLVFALGFSGFSAAAHAFDTSKCAQILPLTTSANDSNDCERHISASDSRDTQSTKDVKHSCLSCGHCCTAHATVAQFSIAVKTPIQKTGFAVHTVAPDDALVSGLKRPPRFLA